MSGGRERLMWVHPHACKFTFTSHEVLMYGLYLTIQGGVPAETAGPEGPNAEQQKEATGHHPRPYHLAIQWTIHTWYK